MIKLEKKTESLQKRQKKKFRTIFEKSKHEKFRLKDAIEKKNLQKDQG
jgi:hypothetical protein